MARREFGVALASYSTVLVQRLDDNPAGKKISSWANFWDVKAFPGSRSLRGRPEYSLEFALLADGVAKDDLYKVLPPKEGIVLLGGGGKGGELAAFLLATALEDAGRTTSPSRIGHERLCGRRKRLRPS